MSKPSLIEQRQAVESLINCALLDEMPAPMDVENAKQAVLTLLWLERRAELVKDVERLDREAPSIAHVLREFPCASIEEVR